MFFGGVDAHKNYLTIAVVDQRGSIVREERRVPIGGGKPLIAALAGVRPLKVVVETCPFWPWIYDTLEPTDIEFHLAHANQLEAIAKAEQKTDSVDARLLARMLVAGLIPEVYPKPAEQREICRLVRHRATLVEQRSALANRMHGHLQQRGLQVGRGKLLTRTGRRWLEKEAWSWLSPEQRALAETHTELIDVLTAQIEDLDDRIEERAKSNPAACLLQSIPGIGYYRSLVLVGEVTPISRFPSPAHLVSYAGLAPKTRQSGVGRPRYGAIPDGANRWVRGALVSAIPSHMRAASESSLGRYYKRQKERLGMPTARVAAARKLCRTIHAMLSTGEVWRG